MHLYSATNSLRVLLYTDMTGSIKYKVHLLEVFHKLTGMVAHIAWSPIVCGGSSCASTRGGSKPSQCKEP